MKRNYQSIFSLVFSTALVAGLVSGPATAQSDDPFATFEAASKPRLVEGLIYTPAVYLSESEDLEVSVANDTGDRVPVSIEVIDQRGNVIRTKRVTLNDEVSRRVILMSAQARKKPLGLVRLEIRYEASCDEERDDPSMFAVRGIRRFDGRFQDVFVSEVENPCRLGVKLGPPLKGGVGQQEGPPVEPGSLPIGSGRN